MMTETEQFLYLVAANPTLLDPVENPDGTEALADEWRERSGGYRRCLRCGLFAQVAVIANFEDGSRGWVSLCAEHHAALHLDRSQCA